VILRSSAEYLIYSQFTQDSKESSIERIVIVKTVVSEANHDPDFDLEGEGEFQEENNSKQLTTIVSKWVNPIIVRQVRNLTFQGINSQSRQTESYGSHRRQSNSWQAFRRRDSKNHNAISKGEFHEKDI
jgi:hypothetical protein